MLYYLSQLEETFFSPLRLFQYVTFRAAGAAFSAFVVAVVFGPFTVKLLTECVAPNHLGKMAEKDEESMELKKATPSMGGILIISATVFSILIWAKLSLPLVLIFLGLIVSLGLVGFIDDYLKISKSNVDGMSGKVKLLCQIAIAIAAVWSLHAFSAFRVDKETGETINHLRELWVPLRNTPLLEMPMWVAIAFGAIVVVAASNAVNLSDGMDGLATGCTAVSALTYACFAYACGHFVFAQYLGVPFISGSSEVSVIAMAMVGACIGFLWHNCFPASMYMGDTGSLALGGSIGLIAVLVRQELMLIIVGGIFVLEAGSVILQVGYFKITRKLTGEPKRLFRCAPIHHHFKLNGWKETQVVIRFWIIAVALAAIGLASLKIR